MGFEQALRTAAVSLTDLSMIPRRLNGSRKVQTAWRRRIVLAKKACCRQDARKHWPEWGFEAFLREAEPHVGLASCSGRSLRRCMREHTCHYPARVSSASSPCSRISTVRSGVRTLDDSNVRLPPPEIVYAELHSC